ncbi:HIT family protein [Consotaella aegiceratis]|uniref:HIT family protein n=1 Tax=Consotaella aegiceratis TaxID=3097961 RepID=UPI002F415662
MHAFRLDPRLEGDTLPVAIMGLCELRLMDDSRWPWLILVPRRDGIAEFHDLTPLDQTMLTFEASLVSKALKQLMRADKINTAMIGNVVAMLHLHVVARFTGDHNWPKPVWGLDGRIPYDDEAGENLARALREAILVA